jgi:hypothetical protein
METNVPKEHEADDTVMTSGSTSAEQSGQAAPQEAVDDLRLTPVSPDYDPPLQEGDELEDYNDEIVLPETEVSAQDRNQATVPPRAQQPEAAQGAASSTANMSVELNLNEDPNRTRVRWPPSSLPTSAQLLEF